MLQHQLLSKLEQRCDINLPFVVIVHIVLQQLLDILAKMRYIPWQRK